MAQSDTGGEGFNRGGRTSFQFLKIGVGARQAGLGEASIASVRDLSSAYWNPAGITGIENYEVALTYTRWLADMDYVAGAIGGSVGGIGSFALTVAALDYGDIPEAILNGQSDGRTGETFSGGDLMLGAVFARQFTEQLSIGIGVKYLHETLWEFGSSTLAFDVGSTYDVGFRGIQIAMAAQNFSGPASWRGEESDRQEGYDLPLIYRIGVSANIVGEDAFVPTLGRTHNLVGSVEAIHSNDYSERLHLGIEYVFNDLFAVRSGYRLNYAEGNFSVGAGLTPSAMGGIRLRLDYAYVGYEMLAAPHRFTVGFAF
ncbi:type IX secretion system outer membrane channel protein PorV [soil metagenome]